MEHLNCIKEFKIKTSSFEESQTSESEHLLRERNWYLWVPTSIVICIQLFFTCLFFVKSKGIDDVGTLPKVLVILANL